MISDESPPFDLHCQESTLKLLEGEEEAEISEEEGVNDLYNYINAIGGVEEDEYLKVMFDREINVGFNKYNECFAFDDWLKSARREAIIWILKNRAGFGFQLQTAYLSVTYIDQFLSRLPIKQEQSWAVDLLSIACLSLAAKLLEPNPPLLMEFQTGGCNFKCEVIQRMELLVLNTLEWRMNSVTPLSFLPCFFTKLCNGYPSPKQFLLRTLQLLTCVMMEISLMEHKPSVIAAAVTLVALDLKSARKEILVKMRGISSCGFFEIEEILECYNLLQKLELKNQDLLGGDSSVSSGLSAKRRRLAFSED